MRKLIIIATVLMLFTACETEIYYTRSVINDTDYDIDLVFLNENSDALPDTIRLDARTTKLIEDFRQTDRPKAGLSCAPERDRLSVRVIGYEALLRVDFFDEDNWESYITGNRSMDQDCYFQINEENLLVYNGN